MRSGRFTEETPAGEKACRKMLHPILALVATGCLFAVIGWTGEVTAIQHWITVLTGLIFAFERGWVYQISRSRGKERQRLRFNLLMAGAVLIVSAVLALQSVDSGVVKWPGGHVFVHLVVIITGISSAIYHQTRFTARAVHPGLVLISSFLVIVIIGTLLLKMPRCMVDGNHLTWLDAAFTSTSAVCVTGLSVHNTATFFSTTGQAVILVLIQIGGLGIMTLTFFASVVLFEGISLHDRLLLGKMLQENRLAKIPRTIGFIVLMTFACEGVGFALLYFGSGSIPDEMDRLFHSLFHSVSAFCNAGFSTFPDGLSEGPAKDNWLWQLCIMGLIVIGGLGSLVNEDLSLWTRNTFTRLLQKEVPRHRLRIHTRLALVVTLTLIVAGTVAIFITEFELHDGPENGGRILTALFHSVTARTAGFNTVPMSGIGSLTIQILMLLMLIGGSPGGTAGGLRTTVVAVGLGHLWAQLRAGKQGMVAFNRTIPRETGAHALGLIVLAGLWLVANFAILQLLQAGSGIPGTKLLFELISSFATVGLSLDLTPTLNSGSKALLIVNMFVGRIGLLTVVATLIKPDTRPPSGKPTEDILLT